MHIGRIRDGGGANTGPQCGLHTPQHPIPLHKRHHRRCLMIPNIFVFDRSYQVSLGHNSPQSHNGCKMFPEQGLAGPQTVLMALLRICISCPGHGWVVVMRPSSNTARHADMQTLARDVHMGLKAFFLRKKGVLMEESLKCD